MEFIEKFETIKKKFDKVDSSKISGDVAVQVNMTDNDCGGAFYIANINNTFSVEPYDYRDHTAMLTTSSADFEKMIAGKIEFDKAVSDGTISVAGNADHVKLLTELFPKTAKKAPAKKAPAKKSTAKKTAEKKSSAKKSPAKKSEAKEVKPSETVSAVKTAAPVKAPEVKIASVKADEAKKTADVKKASETKK